MPYPPDNFTRTEREMRARHTFHILRHREVESGSGALTFVIRDVRQTNQFPAILSNNLLLTLQTD